MRLVIGFLVFLPMVVTAETAYITDNLRLGLHRAEDTSDRAFRMLDSGQALEIISRDRNYASVQLPDGARGYVKAAYLVADKPAKLIVEETIAERDALLAELEQTKQAFAGPAATIQGLKDEGAELTMKLDDAEEVIADLKAENASIQGLKERYKGSLPLSWVAAAIGVCLVGGFLLGLWWVDRSSRRRHGGIRIY
ncbi:MAG: TIGR04211 family SH3 domain-containing protein [Gammaproteobacteria bacterium]|nr:TIGR04211 family SH3 domain-containing protein [Gammaproteobacteria bacterium]MBU2678392.1 TIGR04211 family SH3 domain-containing protein [Gammaproteobacteria bacterium]NNC56283.1 TIGR04211 family SH3 domain-containing protein [Woeseiaceae bacterium]NNL52127.1 TIGR04211 family SH3 domain-containing protein [Woeseiaceae bacterium]